MTSYTVKHFAPQILIINMGSNQLGGLGWRHLSILKKESAILHPGGNKISMQYDMRLDWSLVVQVGMLNTGRQSGK